MSKTVLITGASTGIGKATAVLFQQRGWNVAATMRSPDTELLSNLENLLCLRLDVTEPASIQQAINQTLQQFNSIDVVVNNAGYGVLGVFEACPASKIEQQFATNVFGLMDVTKAILPHFRHQGHGIILNISSIGGRITVPFYSLYHSTKWAIEGFSESLHYELKPFNIKIKIIEPGLIKTDFYSRSADVVTDPNLSVYDSLVNKIIPQLEKQGNNGSPPEVVAQVIYKAATDKSWKLRYPAGGNAGIVLFLRKLLPESIFISLVRKFFIGK